MVSFNVDSIILIPHLKQHVTHPVLDTDRKQWLDGFYVFVIPLGLKRYDVCRQCYACEW